MNTEMSAVLQGVRKGFEFNVKSFTYIKFDKNLASKIIGKTKNVA